MDVVSTKQPEVRHMYVLRRYAPSVADDDRVRMNNAGLRLKPQLESADVTVENYEAGATLKKPIDKSPSNKQKDPYADFAEY
jgi:hypothetical protein